MRNFNKLYSPVKKILTNVGQELKYMIFLPSLKKYQKSKLDTNRLLSLLNYIRTKEPQEEDQVQLYYALKKVLKKRTIRHLTRLSSFEQRALKTAKKFELLDPSNEKVMLLYWDFNAARNSYVKSKALLEPCSKVERYYLGTQNTFKWLINRPAISFIVIPSIFNMSKTLVYRLKISYIARLISLSQHKSTIIELHRARLISFLETIILLNIYKSCFCPLSYNIDDMTILMIRNNKGFAKKLFIFISAFSSLTQWFPSRVTIFLIVSLIISIKVKNKNISEQTLISISIILLILIIRSDSLSNFHGLIRYKKLHSFESVLV
ncbi:MAG: hypothetical protein F6K35_00285 [Okeania sp. SIO2H7]|nr:hypothetical protein [Okeania sp. SIO2H7]